MKEIYLTGSTSRVIEPTIPASLPTPDGIE